MQSTFLSGHLPIRIHQLEPSTPTPHPAILLLHGAGGNINFWLDRISPLLSGLGIALYAPHYFERTKTQRADPATILDGVHVPQWLETVSDALIYIRSRPGVDPNRIALLGISLGAFLALGHAALHSGAQAPGSQASGIRFSGTQAPGIRAVVELSGGLVEPYASRATSAFPPTLILHGEQDQVVSVDQARALNATLARLNVPHEQHLLPGEGHWFSPAAQLRILGAVTQFLRRHL